MDKGGKVTVTGEVASPESVSISSKNTFQYGDPIR